METTTERNESQALVLPGLQVTQNMELTHWAADMDIAVRSLEQAVKVMKVKSNPELEVSAEVVREINSRIKEAEEKIKPFKQRLDEIKGLFLATEKRYVVPLKEMKSKALKLQNDYLDYLEEERKKEEARINEQAAKEREKRLEAINKQLDKDLSKMTSIEEQISAMEKMLEDTENTTVEKAEEIRRRIDNLELRKQSLTQKIDEKQTRMEEIATPQTVTVDNKPKIDGMSERKEWVPVKVINPKAILQAIIDDRLPLSAVDFNMGIIKRLKNAGQSIPGVEFQSKRIITQRTGR